VGIELELLKRVLSCKEERMFKKLFPGLSWKMLIPLALLIGLLVIPGCTWPVDPCSKEFLINSINSANASPGTIDTIELEAGCIYELDTVEDSTEGSNGLPSITSPIIINGNGATVRRGLNAQKMALRLFHVSAAGSLTLNNIILLDGLGMNPPDITLPTVNYAGAVYNNGQLSINNSQILDNRAAREGGAIFNSATGTMSINNTTLSGNQAMLPSDPGDHGGALKSMGTATITNSTFVGNITGQTGGAIANGGTMFISNSTFSGNVTTMLGGSAIVNAGDLEIEYSTIAFNTAGAPDLALFSATGTVAIRNSIISNNSGVNCSYPAPSPITEENLSDDDSCNGFTIVDDPQLDPLANNGGPTMTHAIAPSSPAKNAATGSCPSADQRGEARPHGPSCDLGAYEFTTGGPPATDTPSMDGSISGWTYIDGNENGVRDPAEVTDFVTGAMLTLKEGACPGTTTLDDTESSTLDGSYIFSGLAAGTYCVLTSPLQQTLYPESQTVVVGEGEAVTDVNFRFIPSPMPTLTPTVTIPPTYTFTPIPPTPTFTPIPPTNTFTPVPKRPTPTFTSTPVTYGQIYVKVWKDSNANGVRNRGEEWFSGVQVYVGTGACNDRAMGTRTGVTDANGTAFFDNISLMTYCVYTEIVLTCGGYSYATTPAEVTVVVDHGAAWVIEIGYAPYVC
jgi:hypothetical protein